MIALTEIKDNILDYDKYSYSKLNTYIQCPYSYKLSYINGEKGIDNGFALLGSLVHNILERYFNNEIAQFEMADIFIDEFEEKIPYGIKIKFPEFTKDMTESYKQKCIEFLRNFDGFDGLKIIDTEKEILLLLNSIGNNFLFHGFIDLLAKDENGDFYIIDFKSKSDLKDEELDEYARQLYLYSMYIKYKYNVYPKELWFCLFKTNEIKKVKFNYFHYENSVEWMQKTIQQIKNEKDFKPKDLTLIKDKKEREDKRFFCRNLCSYRNECTYFNNDF